jgi:hypothetical protein
LSRPFSPKSPKVRLQDAEVFWHFPASLLAVACLERQHFVILPDYFAMRQPSIGALPPLSIKSCNSLLAEPVEMHMAFITSPNSLAGVVDT